MFLLVGILFALIRITILLFTTIAAYSLGNNIYYTVNSFFYANSIPCIELIAFMISIIPVLFMFYGIAIKKYFWQRPAHFNGIIFIIAFLFGAVISLMPTDTFFVFSNAANPCPEQLASASKLAHALSTGILSAIFAFIGTDLGVSLKNTSHKIRGRKNK